MTLSTSEHNDRVGLRCHFYKTKCSLTAESVVSITADNLHRAVVHKQKRHVQRATTQVVHQDVIHVRLAMEAESESCRCWLFKCSDNLPKQGRAARSSYRSAGLDTQERVITAERKLCGR